MAPWWASLVVQLIKNPPAMWETWVWSLGWEDPLEKGKGGKEKGILPTLIFWPEEFHGLYSPRGRNSQTQLRDFHKGCWRTGRVECTFASAFHGQCRPLWSQVMEEGLLTDSRCSVNFGLCILSLTFSEAVKMEAQIICLTHTFRAKASYTFHTCVGSSLSLDFGLIIPFMILGWFIKCIICQVKYIEFISSEANSNTQPYYKKLIFAPGIFHGASVSWALGRNPYWEKILRFKGYGVSKPTSSITALDISLLVIPFTLNQGKISPPGDHIYLSCGLAGIGTTAISLRKEGWSPDLVKIFCYGSLNITTD